MKLAAAEAIAGLVENPTAEEIVPSVFQDGVGDTVAAAVASLA
jgi:malate dehydrogenase (oxaloacetate-decarboxylating)